MQHSTGQHPQASSRPCSSRMDPKVRMSCTYTNRLLLRSRALMSPLRMGGTSPVSLLRLQMSACAAAGQRKQCRRCPCLICKLGVPCLYFSVQVMCKRLALLETSDQEERQPGQALTEP